VQDAISDIIFRKTDVLSWLAPLPLTASYIDFRTGNNAVLFYLHVVNFFRDQMLSCLNSIYRYSCSSSTLVT
jgi:hypothetical protein